MAHNLLRPAPTTALGPNTSPAVAPVPPPAFQLISSLSSSLTHDNLVSKPRGEDTQRKYIPSELTNGFFFPLPLLEQVSFTLYLSAGDIFIPFCF